MDLTKITDEELTSYKNILETEREVWPEESYTGLLYQELLKDLQEVYKEEERRILN